MSPRRRDSGLSGVLVVDKPAGPTSHDVVARVRRLAGTRRVGHAGTLDPAATGVLVLGLGSATRLLGHLSAGTKAYRATVRLGCSTTTDDAEGEPLDGAPADGLDPAAVQTAVDALTGEVQQVPSAFSAVKVAGVRAHARARAGEDVDLPPRPVVVHRFEVLAVGPAAPFCDLDVEVVCSAGTYVRALARDLGAALGVGGHLTALRRTAAGPFDLDDAVPLPDLEERGTVDGVLLGVDDAVARALPRRDLDASSAHRLALGQRLPAAEGDVDGVVAGAFGPDGHVVALVEVRAGAVRPIAVLAPREGPGPPPAP